MQSTSSSNEKTTTRKGRVVYDRKKHLFDLRDLERLSKKFAFSIFTIPRENAEAFFSFVLAGIPEAFEAAGGSISFGGGTFGGAGASRTWETIPDVSSLQGIMFIIEENRGGK